jgi:hypothetical protein
MAGLAVVLFLAAGWPGPAVAAEDPDWPCQQRLVPEIAAGMIWSGPPLQSVADRAADPRIEQLAGEIASRRVPLEQAAAKVDAFAKGLPAGQANDALTKLFARTLQSINRERGSIIAGIKKYARGQRALAERITETNARLTTLAADQVLEREQLTLQRDWDNRIYDDRRSELTYVCDQPVLLEQRAFALARAIAGHLE